MDTDLKRKATHSSSCTNANSAQSYPGTLSKKQKLESGKCGGEVKTSGLKKIDCDQLFFSLFKSSQDLKSIKEEIHHIMKVDISLVPNNLEELKTIYEDVKNRLKKKKEKWSQKVKTIFSLLIFQYSNQNLIPVENNEEFDWQYLSDCFFNVPPQELREKMVYLLKQNPIKESWDTNEDQLLVEIVQSQEKKNCWKKIAREFFAKNLKKIYRHPKHCRERWLNYLDPCLNKGEWSLEEDITLLNNCLLHGSKWSVIASCLKGRTQSAIKNRYHHLKIFNKICPASNEDFTEEGKKEISKIINNLENELKFKKLKQTMSSRTSSIPSHISSGVTPAISPFPSDFLAGLLIGNLLSNSSNLANRNLSLIPQALSVNLFNMLPSQNLFNGLGLDKKIIDALSFPPLQGNAREQLNKKENDAKEDPIPQLGGFKANLNSAEIASSHHINESVHPRNEGMDYPIKSSALANEIIIRDTSPINSPLSPLGRNFINTDLSPIDHPYMPEKFMNLDDEGNFL